MTNPASILEVSHLTFRYGQQTALDDVSLALQRGHFLGIIGPNGGGKSTLLRLALGLETPASGSITLFGETPTRTHGWRKRVGFVPQYQSVAPRFPVSAFDVTAMGLLVRGIPEPQAEETRVRVQGALSRVGIDAPSDKPWWSLSGGQKQRVLLARAMVNEPELLLLDEPTVGVDARGNDLLLTWLDLWRKERQLTVVLVTHDTGIIAPICDRLACLNIHLHFHDHPEKLSGDDLEKTYGCPAEMLFHDSSMPHRVVHKH
ncbi:ABC transporter ATP-binding protein [bacterium]|nr:ABC transporter ATP-binding protein [bacterium]